MIDTKSSRDWSFDRDGFRAVVEQVLVRSAHLILWVLAVLGIPLVYLLVRSTVPFDSQSSIGLIVRGEYAVGVIGLGYFACAALAVGGVSIGMCAVGVFALGNGACGIVAMGNYAIGVIAFGNRAIGLIAVGNSATGLIAIGLGGAIQHPPLFSGGRGAVGYVAVGGRARGTYVLAWEGEGRHVLDHRRQDSEAIRFFCKYLPRLRAVFPNALR